MIKIQQMQAEDISEVSQIEQENFSRPWSHQAFLDSIQRDNTIYLVAKQGETVVGYIGMWTALDEGEITNVAVARKFQNKKIGRQLLKSLWQYGTQAGVTLYVLEVRASNLTAITLYEHQGFRTVGIRKDFYEAPIEDGIVMHKR